MGDPSDPLNHFLHDAVLNEGCFAHPRFGAYARMPGNNSPAPHVRLNRRFLAGMVPVLHDVVRCRKHVWRSQVTASLGLRGFYARPKFKLRSGVPFGRFLVGITQDLFCSHFVALRYGDLEEPWLRGTDRRREWLPGVRVAAFQLGWRCHCRAARDPTTRFVRITAPTKPC